MMKEKQTIENHEWEPLKEYQMTEEERISKEEILRKLKSGEFISVKDGRVLTEENFYDTMHFQAYVETLRRNGLDIGRGDAEYGFKMPLPENGQGYRELIIFRRWKKD